MSTALPHDAKRCLGLLPSLAGHTMPCNRRTACARYIQRAQGGEQTPVAQWLCPSAVDYWEHYIEVLV